MAKKPTPDAIDRAMEILLVHWDNVLVLVNRYDPTVKATIFGVATEGNEYAIDRQAEEWVKGGGTGQMMVCDACGSCDCDGDEEDEGPDGETIGPDDGGDDERFNR